MLPSVHPQTLRLSGIITAEGVSYAEFLEQYRDEDPCEYVRGTVIRMSKIDPLHDAISFFLRVLLTAYLERVGGGRVFQDPMLLRLESIDVSRAPDLQVLLPQHYDRIGSNQINGPADLVVEIVSKGSQRRDRFEKLAEYEAAGVPEYWLVDPLRRELLVYSRTAEGLYDLIDADAEGVIDSRLLPGFRLHQRHLWAADQLTLPAILALLDDPR